MGTRGIRIQSRQKISARRRVLCDLQSAVATKQTGRCAASLGSGDTINVARPLHLLIDGVLFAGGNGRVVLFLCHESLCPLYGG